MISLSPGGIRALRSSKTNLKPAELQGLVMEEERGPNGLESTATFFLTGAECPFTCTFCDLWRYTLDGATGPGAITNQVRQGLHQLASEGTLPQRLKLYNASNFFDRRAVPDIDLAAIAPLLDGFMGVTVESHPLLLGKSCGEFSRHLEGRLEVAMGLETAHPEALRAMGKGADLDDFRRAADYLTGVEADLRIFLLIHPPWVPSEDQDSSLMESIRFAATLGAERVSLIPLRRGNGAIEALEQKGLAQPPTLEDVERALALAQEAAAPRLALTADLWDADELKACPHCREARLERLRQFNREGVLSPALTCSTLFQRPCTEAEVNRGW